jgi:hypothetical protein
LACRFDPEDLIVATAGADGMIHIYPVNIEGETMLFDRLINR